MAENLYKKRDALPSEKVSQERLYAMLRKLNDEVKELSTQIRALRNQTERKDNG